MLLFAIRDLKKAPGVVDIQFHEIGTQAMIRVIARDDTNVTGVDVPLFYGAGQVITNVEAT